MINLRMYPRGFLGSLGGAPIKRDHNEFFNIVQKLRDAEPGVAGANAVGDGNQNITILFNQAAENPSLVDTFSFREKYLIEALDAFGTETVSAWVSAQQASPYLSENHLRFINETLAYVLGDVERRTSLLTWDSIIDTTEAQEVKFIADTLPYLKKGMSWPTFFQHWLSKTGGFGDMMQTTYILFGIRRQDM